MPLIFFAASLCFFYWLRRILKNVAKATPELLTTNY